MAQTLVKKLRIQPGFQVLLINQPENYDELLGELPEGSEIATAPAGQHPFVQLFVRNSQELAQLSPAAIKAVTHDGLLWITYPKRSAKIDSDLSRDVVWQLMEGTGLRPVTQISVDATWSALRFRPEAMVGK